MSVEDDDRNRKSQETAAKGRQNLLSATPPTDHPTGGDQTPEPSDQQGLLGPGESIDPVQPLERGQGKFTVASVRSEVKVFCYLVFS